MTCNFFIFFWRHPHARDVPILLNIHSSAKDARHGDMFVLNGSQVCVRIKTTWPCKHHQFKKMGVDRMAEVSLDIVCCDRYGATIFFSWRHDATSGPPKNWRACRLFPMHDIVGIFE